MTGNKKLHSFNAGNFDGIKTVATKLLGNRWTSVNGCTTVRKLRILWTRMCSRNRVRQSDITQGAPETKVRNGSRSDKPVYRRTCVMRFFFNVFRSYRIMLRVSSRLSPLKGNGWGEGAKYRGTDWPVLSESWESRNVLRRNGTLVRTIRKTLDVQQTSGSFSRYTWWRAVLQTRYTYVCMFKRFLRRKSNFSFHEILLGTHFWTLLFTISRVVTRKYSGTCLYLM